MTEQPIDLDALEYDAKALSDSTSYRLGLKRRLLASLAELRALRRENELFRKQIRDMFDKGLEKDPQVEALRRENEELRRKGEELCLRVGPLQLENEELRRENAELWEEKNKWRESTLSLDEQKRKLEKELAKYIAPTLPGI